MLSAASFGATAGSLAVASLSEEACRITWHVGGRAGLKEEPSTENLCW